MLQIADGATRHPDEIWQRFLLSGGDAEASRAAWLAHFVARRKYRKAMQMVVSKQVRTIIVIQIYRWIDLDI